MNNRFLQSVSQRKRYFARRRTSLWKLLGQVSPRAKNRPPCSSRREWEKNETVVFIRFLEKR